MTSHYKPDDKDKKEAIIKRDGNTIIRPKGLDVTWGKDTRYWTVKGEGENEVRELLQVSWLEVTGSILLEDLGLEKGSCYTLSFRVSLKSDAFGWNGCPVYLMVKDPKEGKYQWKNADLSLLPKDENKTTTIPINKLTFQIPSSYDKKSTLSFGLFEIWRGRWKGGLRIHEVIISPKK
ncbi:Phloem protein 2-like [Canna indica]|uniref:Phloem protein 2-like n=1 Tax=Canna indica TaxID=4628 RepID=A0AAQ3QN89_9LILI|nr:Phloem protein 2-like [Canna indica]